MQTQGLQIQNGIAKVSEAPSTPPKLMPIPRAGICTSTAIRVCDINNIRSVGVSGHSSKGKGDHEKLQGSEMITLFCFQVKCEEDMDLFREITYTLLGLIMNLCLEITFLSEVQRSCHPPWIPGMDCPHQVA